MTSMPWSTASRPGHLATTTPTPPGCPPHPSLLPLPPPPPSSAIPSASSLLPPPSFLLPSSLPLPLHPAKHRHSARIAALARPASDYEKLTVVEQDLLKIFSDLAFPPSVARITLSLLLAPLPKTPPKTKITLPSPTLDHDSLGRLVEGLSVSPNFQKGLGTTPPPAHPKNKNSRGLNKLSSFLSSPPRTVPAARTRRKSNTDVNPNPTTLASTSTNSKPGTPLHACFTHVVPEKKGAGRSLPL